MVTRNIEHPDGVITITDAAEGERAISVRLTDPGSFSPRLSWTSRYSVELIQAFLDVRGPAYLCDEIARDEDPNYLQKDLETQIFAYVPEDALQNVRVLDFGCGCGASTAILSRRFPTSEFLGVELEPIHVAMAEQRAAFYGLNNARFLLSPSPDALPDAAVEMDFVFLSAVFEHLLPYERPQLLHQMWDCLKPGGLLLINQTPDLRFPLETHTSGLPLLNYLPDRLAHFCARKLSRRCAADASWDSLLRAGIRGSTPRRIVRLLEDAEAPPRLLRPLPEAGRGQSDLWYAAARDRIAKRYHGWRRSVALALMTVIPALRIPVAPYLTLALQKPTR